MKTELNGGRTLEQPKRGALKIRQLATTLLYSHRLPSLRIPVVKLLSVSLRAEFLPINGQEKLDHLMQRN